MIFKFKQKISCNTKQLKIITLSALILLEAAVFVDAAINLPSSIGIIGGADGPTSIIISKDRSNNLLDWLGGRIKEDQEAKLSEQDTVEPDFPKASEQQKKDAAEKGLLILINKQNPIDKDYKPDDLTPIKYYASNRSEAGRYMRKEAADQFHALVEAAMAEGYEIVMTTAYRSYGFQQILWNNYVANEGEAAASRFSAKPGESEHQSGLAVDVSAPSVAYELTESFGESEEGIWLEQNAHRYGFIIRFPKDKEHITGYLYEPWHIRYVGKAVAEHIYLNELTLEEYLN